MLSKYLLFSQGMNTENPHNLPSAAKFNKIIELTVGTVYLYDKVVVVEINEGVNVSYSSSFSALLLVLRHVGTKPMVYISHRVHSYSLNPTEYKYLHKIPNLKGIAIVCASEIGCQNLEIEAAFFKKPFQAFPSLQEAYSWSQGLLNGQDITPSV